MNTKKIEKNGKLSVQGAENVAMKNTGLEKSPS